MTGIEPATAGSAILCSTAELYTLDTPEDGKYSNLGPNLGPRNLTCGPAGRSIMVL